ncbi:MAG TPA: hypothetical protein PLA03_09490 [Acidobacteriota bacterium]|nr:hypothetical protein [Acidobacteriota bacterium]
MNREKIFKCLMFLLFVLLVVLLFRFRPRIEGPRRLEVPSVSESGVVLGGKDFRYEERAGGETKYIVTAAEVLETSRVEKELTRPVVVIPRESGPGDRVLGEKGTLSLSRQEVRISGDARVELGNSMTISSPAFRLTPQGEVVSEGRAVIRKDELTGAADILRYDRERRVAHLEGNVELGGAGTGFRAARVRIDLKNHSGEIDGPVVAEKEDSRLEAPRGTMSLDKDNRLRSVTLLTPATGETPSMSFSSDLGDYIFERDGTLREIVLRGKVVAVQKAPGQAKLETSLLILARSSGKAWGWKAPGELLMTRGQENVTARSGSGSINGGDFNGVLDGPVRGWDGTGEFSSGSAKIGDGNFELVGDAQVVRDRGAIRADRMILLKDGGKRAEGAVSGKSVTQGGETFDFSADSAATGKSSYPLKLSGNVRIFSPRVDFKGGEATFLSAGAMTACRGASVAVEGRGNSVFLYGSELAYDEAAGKIEASGNPSAEDGKSRLSASEKIVLSFDGQKKAEKVSAQGSALYESDNYTAKGDMIVYLPKEKKGVVSSLKGKAVVTEKTPYRLVTGKKIEFGNKELGITGDKGEAHRGKIEGEDLKRDDDAERHP